jgi:hypothetical protein
MTYKYISLGMNLGHSGAGRVSWFHDECALKMGIVAGGNPERTNDVIVFHDLGKNTVNLHNLNPQK